MEKLISPGKDRSGQEPKSYVYNGIRIEVSKFFLYEVSLHKYWKNGYCLLGIKLYKSNKFIPTNRICKKYKDYTIEKDIILIAAPYKFIKEKNLPIYKVNPKKAKSKK